MKKFYVVLNCLSHFIYGMEEGINNINENIKNSINIKNSNTNKTIEKVNNKTNSIDLNIDINKIENNNIKNSLTINNYDEYNNLVEKLKNKNLDFSSKEILNDEILKLIEKYNIIKTQDILDILNFKDKNDILKKIDEDVEFIKPIFNNKFFYNFYEFIDSYKIYIIIHTIRLILERNEDIRKIIFKSFEKLDCNFILTDFTTDFSICEKIDNVLIKYKSNSGIPFFKKIYYGNIKNEKDDALVSVIDKFFMILFNVKYLHNNDYIIKEFFYNTQIDIDISNELLIKYKKKIESSFKKILEITLTTLHEFNHSIIASIDSFKNNKIIEHFRYRDISYKTNEKINKDMIQEYIENFKNCENFKFLYKKVIEYINIEIPLEVIVNGALNKNTIKNYTEYSILPYDRYNKIIEDSRLKLLYNYIALKKYQNIEKKLNKEITKYKTDSNETFSFFKYLYKKKFLIGKAYSSYIEYFKDNDFKGLYNNFLAHLNCFTIKKNIFVSENKNKNTEVLQFYKYLLNNNYKFKNKYNFNTHIKLFIKNKSSDDNSSDNNSSNYNSSDDNSSDDNSIVVSNKDIISQFEQNITKNYSFFKYLYDNKFLFDKEYEYIIKLYIKEVTDEELYDEFLNYFNKYFTTNYKNREKKFNYMFSFYRFLLSKQYTFSNNNFDSLLSEYFDEYKKLIILDLSYDKELEYSNELKEHTSFLQDNYNFLTYLYDKNFLIKDEYKENNYDIKYDITDKHTDDFFIYEVSEGLEGQYNDFLAHLNSFYNKNNILIEKCEEDKNEIIFTVYKYLLDVKFDFNDKNKFDEYFDDFLRDHLNGSYNFTHCTRQINELSKKNYSSIEGTVFKVNILECFADVFACSNIFLKLQEGMFYFGYWQRILFKYYAEKYETFIKNENSEDKIVNEKNDSKCIII